MSTRRTLLKAGGLGALLAGVHQLLQPARTHYPQGRRSPNRPGLGRSLNSSALRVIRPPGAVPETAFLAGCARCHRCQDACDVGAIQYYDQSQGKLAHTPYIDPAPTGRSVKAVPMAVPEVDRSADRPGCRRQCVFRSG